MEKYTLERLRKHNPSFEGILSNNDLQIVNDFVKLIESTRSKTEPKAGDYLVYTDKYGDYYPNAHIEYTETEERYSGNVCAGGSCAFVSKGKNGIICNGSGGHWVDIPYKKMEYIGKKKKAFWTWGSYGAGANKGIYFYAEVSVWKYTDDELNNTEKNEDGKPYTTKDYNKFYVSDSGKDSDYTLRTGYQYHISSGGMTAHKAFKNKNDFIAWLKTYRGIYIDRGERNTGFAWLWKEKIHQVSPSKFEKMELPIDTFKMNGDVRKCKRIYDEENKTVHTYFVWYWKSLKSASFQNKLRDKLYTYDWKKNIPEYIVARKELESEV